MKTDFEFVQPARVIAGKNAISRAGEIVLEYGTRALIVTGSTPSRAHSIADSLRSSGVDAGIICVSGEPTFESVRSARMQAADFAPQTLIALGGGSVIDTAKAVAMLLTNGGDPIDYAEIIGGGISVKNPSLPLVAIPSTAGTGSEATRNAVLKESSSSIKVSLRSRYMMPAAVILDPLAMEGVPASILAAAGMDALCQLIESFVSCRANAWTDALCRKGIAMASRAILSVCTDSEDIEGRENMLLAACFSGIALANSGLGAAHGFAASLGGLCELSHGLICANFLGPVCRKNIERLRVESSNPPALEKYRELAVLLTGRRGAEAEESFVRIGELKDALPLAPFAVPAEVLAESVISGAMNAGSMKGNPIVLRYDDLADIFNESCERS